MNTRTATPPLHCARCQATLLEYSDEAPQASSQQPEPPIATTTMPLSEILEKTEAWLRQCSTWLLTTDLDMVCPMETDPLDLADYLVAERQKLG